MTHQEIIKYCLQKPYSYLDYPFDPIFPVIKVKSPSQQKGKIFTQIFMLKGEPKITLNCTPEYAEIYRSKYPESITRGYHCPKVQQPHFNTINLLGAVPDEEITLMIDQAYDVVLSKLPKYIQKEILY